MKYLRWLLFPFSLLYGVVMLLRNWCYDNGLFKSRSFDLPVISVGNLDVGGTGKTPMTEYLIRLLQSNYKLATLSRGYGRATTGFLEATQLSTAVEVGDEPAQLKHKFPEITVAVCEDRVAGVTKLKDSHQVILLDDAYQHRAIRPGFSVLLFDYESLHRLNLLLPAGNRREPFSGRRRADVIIITKCPPQLNDAARAELKQRISPYPHQQVFFASIHYSALQPAISGTADMVLDSGTTVFLLTGIANPKPVIHYIESFGCTIRHHRYGDHHGFSPQNISKLAADFESCGASKKIIITTEKDMQRLQHQELLALVNSLPFYTVPVEPKFLNDDGQYFDNLIINYVRKYSTHNSLDQKPDR